MTWQLSITGLLIGALVGLTGMGGGSLMTPILILLFGFKPTLAVGTDILHGAVFKSFGAVRHRRLGTVHAALFDVYSRSPYMAAHQSAAFGRHMIDALTAKDDAKLDMLIGHDTNVTALAALLGFDLVAPGYAVNDAAPGGAILIERWHDAKDRAFVTVHYRTQSPEAIRAHAAAVSTRSVTVRGCPTHAPCPLDRFVRLFGERLAPLAQ